MLDAIQAGSYICDAMRTVRSERGEGRFGALLGLAVLALTVYLGFKIIPQMINVYTFRDFVEEQARFAALSRRDEDIRKRILRRAQELDLPVTGKSLTLSRNESYFDVRVRYVIPIVTPFYTYNWQLDESVRAPLF